MNPQHSRYYIYIKPILKNPIVQTYGPFVFSLITITIFALFAVRPTLITIVALQKSIDEHRQILNQLNTKTENLTAGKNNLDNLPADVKRQFSGLIPSSTSLSNMINNLTFDALATQASISGLQIQPTDLIATPSGLVKDVVVKEIDFTLNTQGAYAQLLNLLGGISKSNRLVLIKSININKAADGSLMMTLNGRAYFLKN